MYGVGIAEQISQNLESYEATVESTSASVDNMTLIGNEDSDIAFALADTASDAVAASATTGGNAFKTIMTWKYTLPAFLVLFPNGEALLLQGPPLQTALAFAVSALAVAPWRSRRACG